MTQEQTATDKAERPLLSEELFSDIGALANRRLEELIRFQSQMFQEGQAINRHFIDRIQSEASLITEFASRLAAARSAPETITACQDWAGRRMTLAGEDTQYLLAEGQKVVEAGARLLSNSWLPNSRDLDSATAH
jgi:hypothetical protein